MNIFANALWIFALALALAVVSNASYRASVEKTRLRVELQNLGTQVVLNVAGFLFCVGLALLVFPIWQTILWTVLALLFIGQLLFGLR